MIVTLLENLRITIKAVHMLVKSVQQEHAVLERQQHTASQFEVDGKQQLLTVVVDSADDTSAVEEGHVSKRVP
jgi:hypothetical protein